MSFNKRYVYLLRCNDGSLYCGISVDPEKRLEMHNAGEGAIYTRSHRPCTLVYTEGPYDFSEALRREAAIKKLKKSEKELLIDNTRA